MHTFKLFLIAVGIFFVTDMIWLGLVAKNVYLNQYAEWLRMQNGQLQPIWWAALMVYILFGLAFIVFILPLAKGSILWAFIDGSILGMVVYGVYDFTCLALFKNWPLGMAFLDWIWGTFLLGFGSMLTVYSTRFIK